MEHGGLFLVFWVFLVLGFLFWCVGCLVTVTSVWFLVMLIFVLGVFVVVCLLVTKPGVLAT
jgi:hypothetical protein